jgi:hypothetical protein
MTIRFDSVKHRFDANETLMLARELESVEATLYEWKEKELKYRMHIPVTNSDNPGAETITYRMITFVGMAKIVANYSHDLPRSDAFTKEYSQKVKTVATSFGYNTQELRAAAMANKPLDRIKADAARKSMRQKENSLAWTGDASHGIIGFLNNTNIPVIAAPAGSSGTTWALKTPDEILQDVSLMTSTVRTQSKGIHNGNTLLLPIAQYTRITTLPRSANSDTVVADFILKNKAYGITEIDWLNELTNAFVSGTKDGAVLYEKSNEVLENRIPYEATPLPMQEKGLEYIINVEARNGGVVVRYPLACLFMTGI